MPPEFDSRLRTTSWRETTRRRRHLGAPDHRPHPIHFAARKNGFESSARDPRHSPTQHLVLGRRLPAQHTTDRVWVRTRFPRALEPRAMQWMRTSERMRGNDRKTRTWDPGALLRPIQSTCKSQTERTLGMDQQSRDGFGDHRACRGVGRGACRIPLRHPAVTEHDDALYETAHSQTRVRT